MSPLISWKILSGITILNNMNDKIEIELAEDEDLVRARAWWKENGSSIIAGIAIGVVMVVGYNYWQSYQDNRANEVAQLYEAYVQAPNDEAVLDALVDANASSTYAQLARMTSARKAADDQQYDQAAALLKEVLASGTDSGLKAVAALRLATVYLSQNKPDEAIQVLDAQADSDIALQQARMSETKADAYLQKGDQAQARALYQSSINALTGAGQPATLVQLKLDNI